MNKPYRVVAAIDFGTHGTGFAWAGVSRDNSELSSRRVSFFENWVGQRISYPKNRSAVLLDSSGQFMTWGYQAVEQMDAMPAGAGWRLTANFKMSLPPSPGAIAPGADPGGDPGAEPGGSAVAGPQTTGPQAAASEVAGPEVAGLEVAGPEDAASSAYRLTVLCLKQVVAKAREIITAGAYEDGDIRWCVTVPAIWSPYTLELMFKAAVEAGLPDDRDRLLLAREPAVAALYCKAKGEAVLGTAGTRFLVVDAGGGTVDITAYQVAPDGRLNQLTPAVGTRTGSDSLNAAFMDEVLAERFGGGTIDRIVSEQRGVIAGTMDAWERAKRSFARDSEDLVISLSAPFYAALKQELDAGRWTGRDEPRFEVVVSRDLVAALFDQRIDETMKFVDQQLLQMRAVSGASGGEAALLVGGFAESPYLKARLASRLADHGVRLIVPEQPSVAVLAGAVHYAYDPSVFMNWRAPFTVGVRAAMPFRPGRDPEDKKQVNFAGEERCGGRFDVFVANRAEVLPGEPVSRTYWPLRDGQARMMLQLVSTHRTDVEYVTEDGVEVLAEMTVDLSKSMHLPIAERTIKVSMHFEQTHVRIEARNVSTNEPQSVEVQWRPTW